MISIALFGLVMGSLVAVSALVFVIEEMAKTEKERRKRYCPPPPERKPDQPLSTPTWIRGLGMLAAPAVLGGVGWGTDEPMTKGIAVVSAVISLVMGVRFLSRRVEEVFTDIMKEDTSDRVDVQSVGGSETSAAFPTI